MSVQSIQSISAFVDEAATVTFGVCHGQSGEWKLESITMVPSAALAEDGSNKFVIALWRPRTTPARAATYLRQVSNRR